MVSVAVPVPVAGLTCNQAALDVAVQGAAVGQVRALVLGSTPAPTVIASMEIEQGGCWVTVNEVLAAVTVAVRTVVPEYWVAWSWVLVEPDPDDGCSVSHDAPPVEDVHGTPALHSTVPFRVVAGEPNTGLPNVLPHAGSCLTLTDTPSTVIVPVLDVDPGKA